MTDYFIWNGVDCRTKGIHVSELPPITIPLERSKQTNVPGRPGSLTQLEGDDVYDDMILSDPGNRCMAEGKRNGDLRQPDWRALQRPDSQPDPL